MLETKEIADSISKTEREKPQNRFFAEILTLIPFFCDIFAGLFDSCIQISRFLHQNFNKKYLMEDFDKTTCNSVLKKEQKKEENSEDSGTGEESENELDQMSKCRVSFNYDQKKEFEKLLKVYTHSVIDFISFAKKSKIDPKIQEKYKISELKNLLPPKKQIRSKEFSLSHLIYSSEEGDLGKTNRILSILCDIQKEIVDKYRETFHLEQPDLLTRKVNLASAEKLDFLNIKEDYVINTIHNYAHTSTVKDDPGIQLNLPCLRNNILNNLFVFSKVIDSKRFEPMRFLDKLSGKNPYLEILVKRFGTESNFAQMKRNFKGRFMFPNPNFRDFNNINRVIFYLVNSDVTDPNMRVAEFLQHEGISLTLNETVRKLRLAEIYQEYCVHEIHLISINLQKFDANFTRKDLSESNFEKLTDFVNDYRDKKIKETLELDRNGKKVSKKFRMGYLEFWLIGLTRFISRFISLGPSYFIDQDSLIAEDMQKCDNLFPEQFVQGDRKVMNIFIDQLGKWEIKNAHAIRIFNIMKEYCIKLKS